MFGTFLIQGHDLKSPKKSFLNNSLVALAPPPAIYAWVNVLGPTAGLNFFDPVALVEIFEAYLRFLDPKDCSEMDFIVPKALKKV